MGSTVHGKIKKVIFARLPVNNHGLTLVEVLISIVLLVIMVNAAYGLLYNGVFSYIKNCEERDIRSQLRIGMNRMERELREARWLTTNTSASILKFRMPNHMTDTNKIIPLDFSKDKIISYYVENGELRRRIYDVPRSGFDGESPNRGDPVFRPNQGINSVARNISSLQLSYFPADTADNSYKTTVIITLKSNSSSIESMVLTSAVQIRAQRGW